MKKVIVTILGMMVAVVATFGVVYLGTASFEKHNIENLNKTIEVQETELKQLDTKLIVMQNKVRVSDSRS